MAPDRLDMDALVKAIAAKFKEHGMEGHLRLLRGYYAERQRRKRAQWRCRGAEAPPWDEDMVLRWAALWRLPPLEHVYEVRPPHSSCRCGERRGPGAHANFFAASVFPEGRVVHCMSCDACWLELDADSRAPTEPERT